MSSAELTFIARLSLMMNATLNLGRRYRGQVVTLIFGVFILCGAFVYSVGGSLINFTSKDFCHLAICLVNCKLATVLRKNLPVTQKHLIELFRLSFCSHIADHENFIR